MVKDIPISRIMTKREDLVTMTIPGNRDILLDEIRKTGLSVYPVLKKDSDELVGIVSRSDLFRNPDETQLSLLMIRDVITLKPNDKAITAARIFVREVFQRIPIVDEKDGKSLVGIVSRNDLVKKVIVPAKILSDVVHYFSPNITTIWEGTPLPDAAMMLRLSHQKGIPVINESKMVGIITQHDFLKVAEILDSQSKSRTGHGAENDSSSWDSESVLIIGSKTLTLPSNMRVGEIMERNVEVCYKGSTISDVSRKMSSKQFDQLPVVSADGKLLGIINQKDVIRAYVDSYYEESIT
ncbi:MAG: CBS domain-containing protein [Candidatus Heimdallarchaeota archaeon]|nr:MAG: CBS domain-containing protein [Candidatus Heimdallarchaeota archaeon]